MTGETVNGGIVNRKLHIVDEDLVLSTNIDQYFQEQQLTNLGFDYHLTAVFGSQSTGKSTLLNMLFETKFDVMDTSRRQQTTKGLWLGTGSTPNILILDVEGTDGRERGEQQDMERKSALFSLAVSEVLIINMFEQDVGRYNGANYGLLKTVLEVNLQLFQAPGSPKTHLLFVIRDHTSTPLVSLQDILRQDLGRMFNEIKKPINMENTELSDYFDLSFVGLAHKVYQPEKFAEDVTKLRTRFCDRNDPDYLFQTKYHRRVPLDGFSRYAEQIWKTIMENKDLNLPTQRQLLAQFRCDEIMKEVLETFDTDVKPLHEQLNKLKPIPDLDNVMRTMKSAALARFKEKASYYDDMVYKKVQTDLLAAIHKSLLQIFMNQLQMLEIEAERDFKMQFDIATSKTDARFMEEARVCKDIVITAFVGKAKAMVLEGSNWSYETVLATLEHKISGIIALRRVKAVEDMLAKAKKYAVAELGNMMEKRFVASDTYMWKNIGEDAESVLNTTHLKYDKNLKALEPDPESENDFWTIIKKEIRECIISKSSTAASSANLGARMRQRFFNKFRQTNNGNVREWSGEEDYQKLADHAKKHALKLLDLFKEVDVDLSLHQIEPLDDLERVLIGPADAEILKDELDQHIGLEIQNVRSISRAYRIPFFAYVVFVFFAWDDIIYYLTNPLASIYNIFLLMIFAVPLYFLFQQFDGPAKLPELAGTLFMTAVDKGKGLATRWAVQKLTEQPSRPVNNAIPASPARKSSAIGTSVPDLGSSTGYSSTYDRDLLQRRKTSST